MLCKQLKQNYYLCVLKMSHGSSCCGKLNKYKNKNGGMYPMDTDAPASS